MGQVTNDEALQDNAITFEVV